MTPDIESIAQARAAGAIRHHTWAPPPPPRRVVRPRQWVGGRGVKAWFAAIRPKAVFQSDVCAATQTHPRIVCQACAELVEDGVIDVAVVVVPGKNGRPRKMYGWSQ